LARRGDIASPAKGFYVIIAPEYHHLRMLAGRPLDFFSDGLLEKTLLRRVIISSVTSRSFPSSAASHVSDI
jgi:hypothetical protein